MSDLSCVASTTAQSLMPLAIKSVIYVNTVTAFRHSQLAVQAVNLLTKFPAYFRHDLFERSDYFLPHLFCAFES